MTASVAPAAAEPQRLADTDWLHHRLEIIGPADTVAAFAAAARGAGVIPWQLDLDRIEEDLFHRLIAPPPPQRRSLSLVGARALARQLREAVAARHEAAVARVGFVRDGRPHLVGRLMFRRHAAPTSPASRRLSLTRRYVEKPDISVEKGELKRSISPPDGLDVTIKVDLNDP